MHLNVFDRLLEIALLLQRDLAETLVDTGLTPARVHLLWELHRIGPCTQQTLAAALDVTPRNVTGLVDALVTAGYVERRPHPDDRRAALVTLTPTGTATVEQMARDREDAASRLVDGLSPDRLVELSGTLDLLSARLRSMITGAPPYAAAASPGDSTDDAGSHE